MILFGFTVKNAYINAFSGFVQFTIAERDCRIAMLVHCSMQGLVSQPQDVAMSGSSKNIVAPLATRGPRGLFRKDAVSSLLNNYGLLNKMPSMLFRIMSNILL